MADVDLTVERLINYTLSFKNVYAYHFRDFQITSKTDEKKHSKRIIVYLCIIIDLFVRKQFVSIGTIN